MALHKLTERTWLDATRTKAVPDGDPEAAYLLGAAGTEIDQAEAERLGLTGKRHAAEADADIKAVEAPPATKAVAPQANKGQH